MRLLVVRNDKLGDFMLAWPALRLLKESLPNCELGVLAPAYTAPMAHLCPWIDQVVIDPGGAGALTLARLLRTYRFDGVVTLFSTTRVGAAAWLARIPFRLAPATKLAQFFYNHRLRQRRSRSEKPEFVYNLELAGHALTHYGATGVAVPPAPYLAFPTDELTALRVALASRLGLPASARWVFLHPGSGGSAATLQPGQYVQLGRRLAERGGIAFVVTAGPGEEAAAASVVAGLAPYPAALLPPEGLPALARSLALADLFVSGSTGPLHIAGALNRPTAAFYPGHRSGSALRWQTLNSDDRRLAFVPPPGDDLRDVSRIDVDAAAETIGAFLSGQPSGARPES